MTVVTFASTPKLDMPAWLGQRSCSFRFLLYNFVTGQNLGELKPIRDKVPRLTHDTGRIITRQITDLFFDRDDTAALDTIQHRLKVQMLLGGEIYDLGIFMPVDSSRVQTTSGLESVATFTDSMFMVDQEIEEGYSAGEFDTDGNVISFRPCDLAVGDVLTGLPVRYTAQPTPYYTIGSWGAGSNRGSMLNDIAVDGDYFAPWFDASDTMRFIRAFDPAGVIPQFNLDSGYRVDRDSIMLSDNLLTAPNRFKVISNGGASDLTLPVYGTYDVPQSAPHSIFNRGFVIPRTIDWQVDTVQQANAIAANFGQRETLFETVEFETPPDPRHDAYDVFVFNGEQWLELSWEMELIEGGKMSHMGRRSYR